MYSVGPAPISSVILFSVIELTWYSAPFVDPVESNMSIVIQSLDFHFRLDAMRITSPFERNSILVPGKQSPGNRVFSTHHFPIKPQSVEESSLEQDNTPIQATNKAI